MSQQTISRFSFPGFIWKIITNKLQTNLVLEIRDDMTRKVSIVQINLAAKKIIWEQDKLQEKWWISLNKLTKEEIVLHGFKSSQNPESIGIFVVDSKTGKFLWENRDLIYVNASDSSILTKDLSDNYLSIDSRTGKVLSQIAIEDVNWDQEAPFANPIINGSIYNEENTFYPKISKAIEILTSQTAFGPIEYLEFNGKIIFSYYLSKGENLVNYLLVVSDEGEILFNETIANEIKAPAAESFFVLNRLLIFIKNRKDLIIFEL